MRCTREEKLKEDMALGYTDVSWVVGKEYLRGTDERLSGKQDEGTRAATPHHRPASLRERKTWLPSRERASEPSRHTRVN